MTRPDRVAGRPSGRRAPGSSEPLAGGEPGAARPRRAAGIRLRPAGATSTSRTPPLAGAPPAPRGSSVSTIVPGGPVGRRSCVDRGGEHLQRLARGTAWSPPGSGRQRAHPADDRLGAAAPSRSHRSSGPIRGADGGGRSSCGRGGGTRPRAASAGRRRAAAPRCAPAASRACPASSSGRICSSSWLRIGPVSSPSSIRITVTPVLVVAGERRVLDRRGAAPSREQREVQVDRTERRDAQTSRCPGSRRRPRRRRRRAASAASASAPAPDAHARRPRRAARPRRRAASATAVGAQRRRLDRPAFGGFVTTSAHRQIRLAGDRLEGRHRPRVVAEERDTHGHGGRIAATYARRRPRGSTSPSSIRRSSASTALRPSSSSRSM